MQMRPGVKGLLIGSTMLVWGLSGVITGEASNYSAQRANSVRLVWRHHMGRHMYHTVKGARYSKHLGVKYSTNDDLPDVTWVTDAHEKLYNKAKRTSAIYYHVKSTDGQHGGWIWRGYLTAGPAPKSIETNTSEVDPNYKPGLFSVHTTAAYQHLIETKDYYALARNVWALFPGTKLNLWLSQFTAYGGAMDLENNGDFSGLERYGLTDTIGIVRWEVGRSWPEFEGTEKLPLSSRIDWLKKKMNKAGLTESRRENFKGWYIGLSFVDDSKDQSNINRDPNTDSDEHPSNYEVLLVPPTNFQKVNMS